MYGLSREQLLHDDQLVPAGIILSHEEQLIRLKEHCPEAAGSAIIAGDPCFDRIEASKPWREHYRQALELRQNQRLVVITSTWGKTSILGRHPELPARLLADLPFDEFRVAAIVHPNVWHRHSPWQLKSWLADCRRSGLLMIPPREGWRAALVAADCVIGDHGSVTLYGASIGRPTILGTFCADDVDPATAIAQLGHLASRLDLDAPIRPQLEWAMEYGRYSDLADQAFAARGQSAQRLQNVMYDLLKLTPPGISPKVRPVPSPTVVPAEDSAAVPALMATCSSDGGVIKIERYPAELDSARRLQLDDPHLVVDDTEPDERLRRMADVLIRREGVPGLTSGHDLAAALAVHSGCLCAADVGADGRCVVRLRDGRTVTSCLTPLDPAIFASIIYECLASGSDLSSLTPSIRIESGSIGLDLEVNFA